MRNIILIFFAILSYPLLTLNGVFSYDSNKFYSTIAENIESMDSAIFLTDIEGDKGLSEVLNDKLGTNCFNNSITFAQLELVVKEGNISYIIDNLNEGCEYEGGKVSISNIEQIREVVIETYNEYKTEAKNKTDTITTISKSGIYSDGDVKNSPFDLMDDIEKIDEIIFERSEEISYEASKTTDLYDKIRQKLKDKLIENTKKDIVELINKQLNLCKLGGNCSSDKEVDDFIDQEIQKLQNSDITAYSSSDFMCHVDNSGLTDISGQILQNSIENKKNNSQIKVNNNGYELGKDNDKKITINSSYNGENDNSLFPCNTFFCVKVNYNIYNHNLLGGWVREYPSIEFLLKRANNHLKPLVAGSLTQSKMTIGNFQLGLKDLNLSEQFHMGVQITSKPVPILDLQKDFNTGLDKDGTATQAIYSLENQFKEYYKSEGLDYERPNDLSNFLDIKEENLATENGKFSSPEDVVKDIRDLENIKDENRKKVEVIKNEIDKKTKNQGIEYLDTQFKEIEIFNNGVKEYINSLQEILNNYKKIPTDSSQT